MAPPAPGEVHSAHKQTLLTTLKIRTPANYCSLLRILLIIRFRKPKRESQSEADATYNKEMVGLKTVTNQPLKLIYYKNKY